MAWMMPAGGVECEQHECKPLRLAAAVAAANGGSPGPTRQAGAPHPGSSPALQRGEGVGRVREVGRAPEALVGLGCRRSRWRQQGFAGGGGRRRNRATVVLSARPKTLVPLRISPITAQHYIVTHVLEGY